MKAIARLAVLKGGRGMIWAWLLWLGGLLCTAALINQLLREDAVQRSVETSRLARLASEQLQSAYAEKLAWLRTLDRVIDAGGAPEHVRRQLALWFPKSASASVGPGFVARPAPSAGASPVEAFSGMKADQRALIQASMRDGHAVLIFPFAGAGSADIWLPVYRGAPPPGDGYARMRQGVGWLTLEVPVRSLLPGGEILPNGMRLELRHLGLAQISWAGMGKASPSKLEAVAPLSGLGEGWQLAVLSSPNWRVGWAWRLWLAGLCGVLASSALALWLGKRLAERHGKAREADQLSLRARNDALEGLVAERTAELSRARHAWNLVLDGVPSLIGYWDRQQINRVANHGYTDWFGVPAESLIGTSLRDLLDESRYQSILPHIEGALRGEPQAFQRELPKPDGRMRYVLTHFLPDVDHGEVMGFFSIAHDVSELVESRHSQEHAQQEVERLLATVNEQLLHWVVDEDGCLLECNAMFRQALGYGEDALPESGWLDESQHADSFWAGVAAHLRDNKAWRGELCLVARDGGRRWLDTVLAPGVGQNGMATSYIALSTDRTDRRQADAELARLNRLLENVLDAASEFSIIATDAHGIITLYNSGAARMLGYSEEEMVGVSTPQRFHIPEEVEARSRELSARYGKPIEGFDIFVHEPNLHGVDSQKWTYVRKDGKQLMVSLVVTTMRDEAGRIHGYLGVAIDITDQVRQQSELTAARDQLQMAAEMAGLGVWSWSPLEDKLQWNRKMYEIYRQPEALEAEGLGYGHWRERIHPDDRDEAERIVRDALDGKIPYETNFRVVYPDGQVRLIQAGARVEKDASGRALRITGINRDITEQRGYEDNLLKAKQQAEQASVAKSRFLANMSHEIRTPMNAVLGLQQLLLHTSLNERQRDYVDKTQKAARSLLGLLNDILDFSKIDADKLKLDPHPFDLEALMRDLAVVLSGNHGEKDVEVMFSMDPVLPTMLHGDRLRLQQVLINLAGNALKFTEQGHVLVSLSLQARREAEITLRFEIIDTGIGIAPDQLERIFDGFTQAEASTTRRFGGTGLGLVISKRLIELMGGSLHVESEPGKGSRFWFELPFGMTGDAMLAVSPAELKADMRVLVVDDNAIAGEILVNTITQVGWQAGYAEGGDEAIRLLREAVAAGQRYDVVLMDWRMPGLDGVAVARQVRQETEPDYAPIIVMVTAFGREVLAEIARRPLAPFCDVLTKPVTPQQLVDSIGRAVAGLELMPPLASAGPRLGGMRVLLVEDNPLNRQVASELLSAEGAMVALAEGGRQGVDRVTMSGEAYDVVIMDMQMPDMDGMEATRHIRADARFSKLPILAMTANVSAADRDACLASGMNDHVGKPIDIDEVVAKLLQLCGLEHELKPEPVLGGALDGALIEPLSSRLRRFGNKLKVYRAALTAFYPECDRLLKLMVSQAQREDWAELMASLHALKGAAATMGALELARQSALLLQQLRAADDRLRRELAVAAHLTALARLAADSAEHLIASLPEEPREKQAVVLEPQSLLRMRGLLEDNNLEAMDLVADWLERDLGRHESAMNQVALCVQRLQFDEAKRIVGELLAELSREGEAFER
ncbi:response regulator [Chromobacterium sp. IIBBL 290-4]|uniref:PAS domain-containing hybrid sensor histidine kinase/response regulator n=1 Tax=Chromobacterium sp. IIBBL 290-4 TaxID=2953890 RepID=UPI0020B8C2F1|nr:response regulator [Chromobacterium sp. IIBBL 290-4]UTH72976.1 response regulator [Chromobacterium sp. IIBBL 290-4]